MKLLATANEHNESFPPRLPKLCAFLFMLCSMATKAPNRHIRWAYKLFHACPKAFYLVCGIIFILVLIIVLKFTYFLICEYHYSKVNERWGWERVDVYEWCNELMDSHISGDLRFCFLQLQQQRLQQQQQ